MWQMILVFRIGVAFCLVGADTAYAFYQEDFEDADQKQTEKDARRTAKRAPASNDRPAPQLSAKFTAGDWFASYSPKPPFKTTRPGERFAVVFLLAPASGPRLSISRILEIGAPGESDANRERSLATLKNKQGERTSYRFEMRVVRVENLEGETFETKLAPLGYGAKLDWAWIGRRAKLSAAVVSIDERMEKRSARLLAPLSITTFDTGYRGKRKTSSRSRGDRLAARLRRIRDRPGSWGISPSEAMKYVESLNALVQVGSTSLTKKSVIANFGKPDDIRSGALSVDQAYGGTDKVECEILRYDWLELYFDKKGKLRAISRV